MGGAGKRAGGGRKGCSQLGSVAVPVIGFEGWKDRGFQIKSLRF